MPEEMSDVVADLFEGLLRRTHLSRPSDVADVVVGEAERALDARDVVVYWVDRGRTELVPVPSHSSPPRARQQLDGTLAGRAFTASEVLSVSAAPGWRRAYVPVLDGTDRVGVLELELPVVDAARLPEPLVTVLERFGHAVAMILMTKKPYGDALELVQRTRPMEVGAELLWSVLPPLTYATDGLVIAGMLEPAYDNGGDAFDYAVNAETTHLAVFDGVGHGLAAAGMSTFAVAAYRHSRRTGLGLVETYAAMDEAISATFGEGAFVTGLLARLQPDTGVLRWVNAGHPPPLLLRDGRVVKLLETPPATPLGMPMFDTTPNVAEEQLEPGDALLLYTDGVVEARRATGGQIGIAGLAVFLEREAAAQQSPPETLRRLQQTMLSREQTVLQDDATALLVEWRGGSERRLLPQTV